MGRLRASGEGPESVEPFHGAAPPFHESFSALQHCSSRAANRLGALTFNLTGCGKTLWAHRNFTGLHVWNNRSTPRRMLKKAVRQGAVD